MKLVIKGVNKQTEIQLMNEFVHILLNGLYL